MEVSVIIPVYNAAKYIEEAVESAIDQPESSEIILIEDSSQDNSLLVCRKLDKKYNLVRLLQHFDRKNHGAGASRNLGIINSRCEYIAFLDADDYYLPGRFTVASRLFSKYPEIDGVYEATGFFFENESARAFWYKNMDAKNITTVSKVIPSNKLFFSLVDGSSGSFTTDAIVVKSSIFNKTGLFDESLLLHQDTAMWIKMAAVGNLIPGNIEKPVAIRRVTGKNRILNRPMVYNPYRKLLDEILCIWSKQVGLTIVQKAALRNMEWENRLIGYNEERKERYINTGRIQFFKKSMYLVHRLLCSPSLLFSPCFPAFIIKTIRRLFKKLFS